MTKFCRWRHRQNIWRSNLYFKIPLYEKGFGQRFLMTSSKFLTMFFITIYKDSRKVKINRNYVSKYSLYLYFLIWQNLLISGEKMLISAELKECVTWFIYFLDLYWVRYNCAKFHNCRICVTDFREGAFLPPPPIRERPRKSPSWVGLRLVCAIFLKFIIHLI